MFVSSRARNDTPWVTTVLAICSLLSLITASNRVGLNSRNTVPAPYVFPATDQWDGNDGPWSTFALQIGTPPQTIKVQISTSASQLFAVTPEGCTSGDSLDCKKLRGEFFNYNESSTYSPNLVNRSSSIYGLGLESSLGYTGRGRFGFDDITLGWQGGGGPVIRNHTVAGIATKEFFMGLLGLTPRATNFTNYNNPFPSIMQSLRNQTLIPSSSWGYTAGNQYRLNKVSGSLTLGGYDSSKFIPNNVSFPISGGDELVLQLQRITTNNSVSLLSNSIMTTLDSTVPHIWLPNSTCELFESAFGLVWNETLNLYLLNDTQHRALETQNPTITFTVSPVGSDSTVDISLPYSTFDLISSAPITPIATRYFPLRRANNESQYLIGRTFFQEAYIIADFERKNFSVSQCNWTPNQVQKIVTILPPSDTTGTTSEGGKISKSVISGIAAGGAALIIISCILLEFYYLKPRRKQKAIAELEASGTINPTNDPDVIKPELYGSTISPTDPKFEVDAKKYDPPVEIGGHNPIFEMPAREEVAIEMSNNVNRQFSARGYRKNKKKARNESVSDIVSPESPVVGWSQLRRTMTPAISPATDFIGTDTATETNLSWASSPEPTFSTPLMGSLTPLPPGTPVRTRSPQ